MKQLAPSAVAIGLALGVFLVARRAIGALAAPLPPLLLIATAAALFAWAVGLGLLAAGDRRSRDALLTLWLPALTILLFAVACSYPGNRWLDWIVWMATFSGVFGAFRVLRPARRSSPADAGAMIAREQILQQVTRYRDAEGHGSIRGTIIAEFDAGQRETALHIAFCPPFEHLPDVTAHIAEDVIATVKLAQRLHNGAQLDVRRPAPAEEPLSICIELWAVEPTPTETPRPPRAL